VPDSLSDSTGPTVRLLTEADTIASRELSHLAFGAPRPTPEQPLPVVPANRWGALDGAGRLLAKASDREQEHWFGGCRVPTSGVAGVAVAPELRGRGLAQLVLRRLLAEARHRGAVIATLFRTAPALYRRLGFEQVGALSWVTTPTLALAGLRVPDDVTLRPAAADDVGAVQALYRTLARGGNGLIDRVGPLFVTDPATVLDGFDGITLALGPDGTIEGYCSWDRGTGYGGPSRLTVWDLLATTGRATRGLLAAIGSWSSVLPTVALRLPDPDPARWLLPVGDLTVESQQPWMLAVLDAAGAVAARGWPSHLDVQLDLALHDGDGPAAAAPSEDGRCRLVLDGGEGRLEPGGTGSVRLDVRGLSVLYAGGGSSALLRRVGLLAGGDRRTDELLDAATAGPAPTILDYF
jgi:predicted acetyltransferase